eukprot:CAMPEP_0184985152 /NCGR_PEP_ID=MMETSP1098-20130426/13956_1 /TAXON_ID=89044 /ORGANISM="Spumella elongata, Strain CCAP 955/1" /LENGTH=1248 /DNA_ID=CAMNT_0027509227 /DNA_START=172 /DNA_END=3918 /DNA_ORIENTATION=+
MAERTTNGVLSPAINGKKGHGLPLNLPRVESNEAVIDAGLLDVMGIEDYLSLLKNRTDNNPKELWKEMITMAHQLKASRELLSIGSSLFSNKANRAIMDRLVESAHVILNAERVYLMEIDPTGSDLVVTYSKDEKAVGLKTPLRTGIEGDVVSKRICVNVPDAFQDPRFSSALDAKLGLKTRCVICAPIICNGIVVGVIQAINKKPAVQITPRSARQPDFSLLTFSSSEAMMLNYIASNAGLALMQFSSPASTDTEHASYPFSPHHPEEVVVETYRPSRSNSISKQHLADFRTDKGMQGIMQSIYHALDADRVSMFTYSADGNNLVCALSQDIEGFSIPTDRGYAGYSFTAMRMVNVADIKADGRHYSEVDSRVGYVTRNLLCAPIMTSDGSPVGVIQAVNKKSGPCFTLTDEQQMLEVCKRIVALLQARGLVHQQVDLNKTVGGEEKWDEATQRSVSPLPTTATGTTQQDPECLPGGETRSLAVARSVSNMMLSQTVLELAREAERLIHSLSDCDYVGLFVLNQGSLFCVNIPGRATLPEIPPPIKQALQFGSLVEFKHIPPSKDSGDSHDLIPGVTLDGALIHPLTCKVYPYKPGSCVLVTGRRGACGADWASRTRNKLEAVVEYINEALISLSQRLEHNDSVKLMKAQYNLVNNSLGALRDFVILLNEEGRFIGSNKIVEELLGFPFHVLPAGDTRMSMNSNGSQKPHPPPASIVEGSHYSEWLNNGNSPELCRDISLALQKKTKRSLDKVKFFSAVHPNGILIDYQVVPIENPEVREDRDIPTPRLMLSRPQSSTAMPQDDDVVTGLSSSNSAVVVVIHTENFHHQRTLGPSASHGKSILSSFSQVDQESAHSVVDAAATIVNNVRASFMLSGDVEEALKHITHSLSNASRKLSLVGSTASPVSHALQSEVLPLVSDPNIIPKNVFDWEFNVLEITDGMTLCSIIGKFFETLFNFEEICVDTSTLARYIVEVGKNYHDRPFHNLQHSTCVSHFTFKLLTGTDAAEKLSKYQQFSILVSAVVHDVDHPGNTNLFEVNSASQLALLYNDSAVLENHHCSTAFRIMRKPNMQILSNMPKTVATDVRKMIISCVMATDMAVHFELIDETKRKALDGGIDFDDPKEQTFLGKILLHAADLSNPVRPFHMTREWARRISLEFNDQVHREQVLGMPVLGFMMTPDEKAFCKNETGFASFVVAPMWRAMSMLYPQLNFLVEQLESNVVVWKESLEKIQSEEEKTSTFALHTG